LPILNAIAHFNHHLGRHGSTNPLQTVMRDDDDILKNVTMELYRLTNDGGNRVPIVGNLLVDNEAKLGLDKKAEYGIAIFNNSQYDLFPYLFYFDPSEYSIQSWYLPAAPNMDPPLPQPQGRDPMKLTVGYGAGGGDPFEFTLNPGEQSDTGFLKLFVSTKYVDMECITQKLDCITSKMIPRKMQRKKVDLTRVWGAWVAAINVSASGSISVGL